MGGGGGGSDSAGEGGIHPTPLSQRYKKTSKSPVDNL